MDVFNREIQNQLNECSAELVLDIKHEKLKQLYVMLMTPHGKMYLNMINYVPSLK